MSSRRDRDRLLVWGSKQTAFPPLPHPKAASQGRPMRHTSVLSPSYLTANDSSDAAPASASAFMLRMTYSTTSAGPMQSAPMSSMPSGGGAPADSSVTAIRALRLAHSASSDDIERWSAGAVHRSSGMAPTAPTASAWAVVHSPRARRRSMGVRGIRCAWWAIIHARIQPKLD